MQPEVRNLNNPDQQRIFEHGNLHLVDLPGATIGRAVFQPGWQWSRDVQPVAGTDTCQVAHTAYVVSGHLHVRMDNGEELHLEPGDAHFVPAGHDAWVVGNDPCIIIDFAAAAEFANTTPEPNTTVRVARCPCGVTFHVDNDSQLDHLIEAVQQHAAGSHGHDITREHVLEELTT